jgi:KaiC/GvpD/RAD55 family RecA-like ATPase
MKQQSVGKTPARAATGIAGLDAVLNGGLPINHLYLVEGDPGSGKTTLGIQFLLEGRRNGESGLYVTLSETADELQEVAASHHWSLDGIGLFELESIEERLRTEDQAQVVSSWSAEGNNYNSEENSCSSVCGHYTQIVWRDSKEVGCGSARNGNRQVWVCEYNPPGNFVGQRPY